MENPYPTAPENHAELMHRIEHERAALEALIDGVDAARLTAAGPDGWSIKDHLAHIVMWQRLLLHSHIGGQPFGVVAGFDAETAARTTTMTAEDGLNDIFHERDRVRPLADVLSDFRTVYAETVATLPRLSFADLQRLRQPENPEQGSFLDVVIGDTYDHDRAHRAQIAELLQSTENR